MNMCISLGQTFSFAAMVLDATIPNAAVHCVAFAF